MISKDHSPPRLLDSARMMFFYGLLALLCLGASLESARAQGAPILPPQWYEDRLDRGGDQITFCVNEESMMADFERDLAREIGTALLLNVDIFQVRPPRPTRPLDYRLPLSAEQLFVTLVEDCNAMLGFVLSDSFEEWLTISRPYMATGYTLAVRGDYDRFGDIPRDQPIGTRGMNNGDIALIGYLQSLSETNRWRRFPYYDNEVLIERLLDGTVAAAVVWVPALSFATDGDPSSSGIRVLPLPFTPRQTQIGIAMLAEDVFLRTAIDEAIEVLVEDGTVAALMVEHRLALPEGR